MHIGARRSAISLRPTEITSNIHGKQFHNDGLILKREFDHEDTVPKWGNKGILFEDTTATEIEYPSCDSDDFHITSRMHSLLLYEEERSGEFLIRPGLQGGVNIISSDPFVIAVVQSADPLADFNFQLEGYKDGKPIGCCTFCISELPPSKLKVITFPFKGSPDASTITFSVCWMTPGPDIGGPIPIGYLPFFAIGHRGSGSNRVSTTYHENSMESFKAAHAAGAEFVEFDIQMTADGSPVIFHDLIGIIRNEPIPGMIPYEITFDGKYRYVIKQFTEDQFRETGLLTDFKARRATFSDILKELPESLAFDVEIKYPSRAKVNKQIPYFSMNLFVDKVLATVKPLAGNRKMFFSCFDPVICAMLSFKQQKWPVFQLFSRKKRWTQKMMNDRVMSLIPFHKSIGIQGFVFDSEHLMESLELVPLLLNHGFILSTYGALNNTRKGIERQIALGIRGICTDNMELCRQVLDEHLKNL
jgi:glycerophosphoryl diester phosphodiesterase